MENAQQYEIQFESDEKKLQLVESFNTLKRSIESAITNKHLQSLFIGKAAEVLGELSEAQAMVVAHFVEDKSPLEVDSEELADVLLTEEEPGTPQAA